MGEIFDVCCDYRVSENQHNEFDQEILSSQKPNRIKAVKLNYDTTEYLQKRKTSFHSEETEVNDTVNKNKLRFTMHMIKHNNDKNKDKQTNNDDKDKDSRHNQSNDSLNLDTEGKTKSKMIPFIDDIPLGTSGGGGSSGFALPLQRYQYEDSDFNHKFAAKKIKKMINEFNSSKKIKQNSKKIKKEEDDTNEKNKDINFISSIQKPIHDHLTIFLTYPGTQIDKSLIKSPKELLISFDKIKRLGDNGVVFDGEIIKMSYQKSGCKIAQKYLQITKDYFKYFNSISSQQVYKNKPLLQIAILDIEKIEITNDNLLKLKRNSVQFAFKIILDNQLSYDFGCDDPDYGANIISILTILKKYAYQRAFASNNEADFKLTIDNLN